MKKPKVLYNVSIQKILQVYYIENIIVIHLCCNLHHYYLYCLAHIYKKYWLTNRLSLPIIFNLISESSAVRTFLSLSPLQPASSLTLLNGLYYCYRLLFPTKPVVQPSRPATQKLLSLVLFPTSSSPNLQSRTMVPSPMFLSHLFTSWGQQLALLLCCPTLIK